MEEGRDGLRGGWRGWGDSVIEGVVGDGRGAEERAGRGWRS